MKYLVCVFLKKISYLYIHAPTPGFELHHDLKSICFSLFLCFFVSSCLTLWKWRLYFFPQKVFDGTTIELLGTIFPILLLILLNSSEVALCTGEAAGANHNVPPGEGSSSTPGGLPDLNEPAPPAAASNPYLLDQYGQRVSDSVSIADHIRRITSELGICPPSEVQAERLTDLLKERHGSERMSEIRQSLEAHGSQSQYFKEVLPDLPNFRVSSNVAQEINRIGREGKGGVD